MARNKNRSPCKKRSRCKKPTDPKVQGKPVIHLTQEDFSTGTYRIKQSGTYILDENISFDAPNDFSRPDQPITGWFAAITVETDDVVINLNKKTLDESSSYLNSRDLNIFVLILLQNTPLSGNSPQSFGGGGIFSFQGDTGPVFAHRVLIKNGVLGRCGHINILGNNNSDITIRELLVADWEVSGIALNAVQRVSFKNVEVSGIEHLVTISALSTEYFAIQFFLLSIINNPLTPPPIVAQAQAILEGVVIFIAQNPVIPPLLPANTIHGIKIESGPSSNIIYPTTPDLCPYTASSINGQSSTDISFQNIFIHDIKGASTSEVTLGSRISGPFPSFNTVNLGQIGIQGLIRWSDVVDSSGNFAPNSIAVSLAFIASIFIAQTPALLGLLPPNSLLIFQAILTNDSTLFFDNAQPAFNYILNTILNKGLFALRVDCSQRICANNIKTKNLQSFGEPYTEITDIPAIERYPDLVQPRYEGNDIFGVSFSSDIGLVAENICVDDIFSLNGYVFSLDLPVSTPNAVLRKINIKNAEAKSDNINSSANPSSQVYGIRVKDNENVKIKCVKINGITSPRYSEGISVLNSENIQILCANIKNILVTSPNNLFDPIYAKNAIGYLSQQSINTKFLRTEASNVKVLGETGESSQTQSVAAGYIFDSGDNGSKIIRSSSHDNHSGSGKAVGVLITEDSSNTSVISNLIYNNIADKDFAEGFGIQDTNAISSALIENNFVYNNSTANYEVNPNIFIEIVLKCPNNFKSESNENFSVTFKYSCKNITVKLCKNRWIVEC